jgi:protease-4
MPNVVEAIQKFSKPIYCHFSGMCCSAAYWLACACDGIYASQATDITGSIGALIQIVYDNPEFTHEFSVKTVYATKSTEKNKEFNDAIAGDDKRLKKIWLDPITNKFISDVTANRKDVSDKAFTGTTMTANDALSMNLIDGIQSLDETILQSRS